MTADLTPTEVAALRELLVRLRAVQRTIDESGYLDKYTREEHYEPIAHEIVAAFPALIHAAYDDTGQPWRDRAERAEAKVERFRCWPHLHHWKPDNPCNSLLAGAAAELERLGVDDGQAWAKLGGLSIGGFLRGYADDPTGHLPLEESS